MNMLDTIVAYKKKEVSDRKSGRKIAELEKSAFFGRQCYSLAAALKDERQTGIIAEFKRKSPSKGMINPQADILKVTKGYTDNGASCLSVLTDAYFFGGSSEDLEMARVNRIPILRKEFIIDEYQVYEAKSIGADVILLIAACLTPRQVRELAVLSGKLGMEVILEIHDAEELGHITDETSMVGINNRNLKTFEVDIDRSLRMSEKIAADKIKIAESGISTIENILLFKEHGYKGFLIGENFMKQPDPTIAFAEFVNQLKAKAL
ncbi:MAG: indole-3-glycerol phosphate synthase TrpC [Terrimonas sp.]|nr:indole-3-glycerol phosphate synthase TrpC [Terrimonas sp.]